MKKSLLASTLIAATALAVPAWAESSSDLGFEYNNSQFYMTSLSDSDEDYGLETYTATWSSVSFGSTSVFKLILDSNNTDPSTLGMVETGGGVTVYCNSIGNDHYAVATVSMTFSYGASVVVDTTALVLAEGQESIEIMVLVTPEIIFYEDDGTSLSFSSTDTTNMAKFIDEYITVIGDYTLSDWKYEDNVLYATISPATIPEPSMFGILFGLGAIGLVETRRRRRA